MSTIVYKYSFKLPFRKTASAKASENGKKRGGRSSIKDLVTTDSYPSISVNINQYIQFANEKYIECSADAARSEKRSSPSSRGSFRTRNKFMIARNMFCRLVKHEKSLMSTEVSKIVSIVSIFFQSQKFVGLLTPSSCYARENTTNAASGVEKQQRATSGVL